MDRDSATKCLAALILAVAAPACANGDSAGTMGDDSSGSVVAASGSASPSSGSVSPSSGSSSSSSGSLFATSGSLAPSSGTTASSGGSGSNASTSSGGFGSAGNSAGESSDAAIGTEATEDASGGPAAAEGGNGGPPPSTGLSVLYQVGASASTSAYLGCEISITNGGTSSPAVSSLKARYYFTDEVHLTEQMTINWSHISTSGADADSTVTAAFAPLVPAATDADTYIEFSFSSGHSSLAPGEAFVFSWQLQGPDPAKDVYTQSNDYSFDASKTSLTSWSHIVLLQNGSVVWGQLP
jgi:hypothetical protein